MRKKELIDLVVERSGIKKKDAKPVVEAMLAVLGEAIGGGRELNLQPLGKLRINRSVERSNGRIIICKLRQSTVISGNSMQADETASDPLADDDG
ncbi:DNA-binding protein [Rhodobacterales bacterium 56_14_T64]|nr:DNA-binding protein [Rhodobacterales bacterium 56_14_T64]